MNVGAKHSTCSEFFSQDLFDLIGLFYCPEIEQEYQIAHLWNKGIRQCSIRRAESLSVSQFMISFFLIIIGILW